MKEHSPSPDLTLSWEGVPLPHSLPASALAAPWPPPFWNLGYATMSNWTVCKCRGRLLRRRACRHASTSQATCGICWWMMNYATSLDHCYSSWTETYRSVRVSPANHILTAESHLKHFSPLSACSPLTWKTWKSWGIWRWLGDIWPSREKPGKLWFACGVLSCDSHKINVAWVLLSKVDMHKMGCQ